MKRLYAMLRCIMETDFMKKVYTLTYYISNFTMHLWDFFHGTDFSFIDKSVEKDGRSPYYATPWASLFCLDRYIKKHLSGGRGHAVLDIGCGKGFMLYIFSRQGFRKVAGIEYDRRIRKHAIRNLKKMCGSGKKLPVIYCGDASLFRKYSEYDVYYLYHPFGSDTLRKVMNRIMDSLEENPRRVFLFYCNPVHEGILREFGWKEMAHFYYKTKVYTCERTDELVRNHRKMHAPGI